jgi:tyrosine-protein kinase Etk/Wzc
MASTNSKEFHLLDYVDFLVKRKEMFTLVFICSLIVIYLGIFFLVEEQYESTALLLPRSDDATSIASGLLRSMKGLTFGMAARTPRTDTDLYGTIIYSRTMLEDLIRTFGLLHVYGLDSTSDEGMELAVKRLTREIFAKETQEWSYVIAVRANSPTLSADMVNTIVRKLNDRIVQLNTSRSRENRMFLERRVAEVRQQLRSAEDSLRVYSERSGLMDAKSQLEGIVTANTRLESELAARKIQQGILERMYDKESPQVKENELQISAYEAKLVEMRRQHTPGSALLPLNRLPATVGDYLRRYRDVQINNLILEYITPLYEQAKLDEARDYPILQVVDSGIPPAKKSYPPRVLFSLIGAFSVTVLLYAYLLLRNAVRASEDSRLVSVLAGVKRWDWKSWKHQA